jgi:hypothetical protein
LKSPPGTTMKGHPKPKQPLHSQTKTNSMQL